MDTGIRPWLRLPSTVSPHDILPLSPVCWNAEMWRVFVKQMHPVEIEGQLDLLMSSIQGLDIHDRNKIVRTCSDVEMDLPSPAVQSHR